MVLQFNPLSQHFEELIEDGRRLVVPEEFFLCSLSVLLVEDAELKVINKHVLVVSSDKRRCAQTRHRHKVVHIHLLVQHLCHSRWRWYYTRS